MKGSIKEYQNREFETLKGPRFLILDSEGQIHYFRYSDANYFAPTVSMFVHPLTIEDFTRKQKRLRHWGLNRTKKYRRCQSLSRKIEKTLDKKNRSKSQIKMEPSCQLS